MHGSVDGLPTASWVALMHVRMPKLRGIFPLHLIKTPLHNLRALELLLVCLSKEARYIQKNIQINIELII